MALIPCLAVGWLMKIVAVLFILVSLILIFIILLQRGKGGGLSAVLGGGMASGLLGSKTGDVLTWVTIVLAALFLVVGLLMAKYYRPGPSLVETAAPAAVPATPVDQPTAAAPVQDTEVPAPTGADQGTQPAVPPGPDSQ